MIISNEKRKQTRQQTKERRKLQVCKTYKVKIDKSSLSETKIEYLARLFLEAKWWYNYILMQDNVFVKHLCTTKIVKVMNKDRQFENRELKFLSFKAKQSIQEHVIANVKSLSTKKKKGYKVGKFKFKSFINMIPGRYFIKDHNKIKIDRFKQCFRVRGLDQIPENAEITTIKLIRRYKDYYFYINTFQTKQTQVKTNQYIGIDLGIKTVLNFSNRVKIDANLPINNKIKKLHQNVSKKMKHSKNRDKARTRLQKAYIERDNQKEDVTNKIVHILTTNFDNICIQNDNITKWQQQYGKKVDASIIGRTVGKLKQSPKTIIVDRYFPSTKLCPVCNTLTTLTLSDRVFKCQNCGYEEDRDIKAARMILVEGMKQVGVPVEYRDLKLVENETAAKMSEYFKSTPHIKVSFAR